MVGRGEIRVVHVHQVNRTGRRLPVVEVEAMVAAHVGTWASVAAEVLCVLAGIVLRRALAVGWALDLAMAHSRDPSTLAQRAIRLIVAGFQ